MFYNLTVRRALAASSLALVITAAPITISTQSGIQVSTATARDSGSGGSNSGGGNHGGGGGNHSGGGNHDGGNSRGNSGHNGGGHDAGDDHGGRNGVHEAGHDVDDNHGGRVGRHDARDDDAMDGRGGLRAGIDRIFRLGHERADDDNPGVRNRRGRLN